ncbi:type I polyketide synthase [Acanthopleuribacter pedis]|uniref:Acyltransferase domain-containing protein n=1 Tax=Acanthopleuribacter pedis TaxID=442870 RepID=A0A8J7Q6G7_9BACT|nr:type I polyketide synthase [Acanthopleuribacter pedis]MBO1318459.1 acyltransferase domain-containing protein [Acanthopleuribacter pedis]
MSMHRKILELFQQNELSERAAVVLLAATKAAQASGAKAEPAPASATPGAVFEEPIAVVGLACRLPDAPNARAFWENLNNGHQAVTKVPESRWPESTYFSENNSAPGLGYARWGAFLNEIYDFDAAMFGLTEEEAAVLDPQQRLMMEVARETLDHAGYGADCDTRRDTGIFIGGRMNDYGRDYFRSLREAEGPQNVPINRASLLGRSQNFMAAWVADRFNLHGPALVTDTACSSSLTALYQACAALRLGECEMALAGGVDLLIDPLTYVMLSKTRALSPDGRCWTFDRRANGYVPGEGAGAALLKPLSAAQRDGDTIYATIRAAAVNNDGHTMGITTPDMDAQIALLDRIYGENGIDPESVGLIEAHGTGTTIGDPIEVKALSEVFRRRTKRSGYCAIGSVKTNIGHLHSASGIAGFLKTVMSLRNKTLVPTLNCEDPNPRFAFHESPFYPNLQRRPWSQSNQPRRAGISSFGFGGTNVHLCLEEAPADNRPAVNSLPSALLTLSAPNRAGLIDLVNQWITLLEDPTSAAIHDLAATSQAGRKHEQHRLALVVPNRQQAISDLRGFLQGAAPHRADSGALYSGEAGRPKVAFVVDPRVFKNKRETLRQTFAAVPELTGHLQTVCRHLPPLQGEAIEAALCKDGPITANAREDMVLFCLGLACLRLLRGWGLQPKLPKNDLFHQKLAAAAKPRADVAAVFKEIVRQPLHLEEAPLDSIEADSTLYLGPVPVPHRMHTQILPLLVKQGAPLVGLHKLLGALYVSGAAIDWSKVVQPGFRRVPIPSIGYQRKTLKVPEPLHAGPALAPPAEPVVEAPAPVKPEPVVAAPPVVEADTTKASSTTNAEDHPMLTKVTMDEQRRITFECAYSMADVYFRDHLVLGSSMLPGMAWLEIVRAAVESATQLRVTGFGDVTFLQPLRIDPGETKRVTGIVDPNSHFEVHEVVSEGAAEKVLLRGRISFDSLPTVPNQPVADWAQRCTERTYGDEVYRVLRELGYTHGPFFQNIHWMSSLNDYETFAELKRAERTPAMARELKLDPGMLDSTTIAAFGSGNGSVVRSGGQPFIPIFLGSVRVYEAIPAAAYAQSKIHVWNGEMSRCTQTILDHEGRVCVVIEDIVSKKVPLTAFAGPATETVAYEDAAAANPEPEVAVVEAAPPRRDPQEVLLTWLSGLMEIELDEDGAETEFLSLGMDSTMLVTLTQKVEKEADIKLYPTVFFEYQTPLEFTDYMQEDFPEACQALIQAQATREAASRPKSPAPQPSKPVAGVAPKAPVVQTPVVAETPAPAPVKGEATPITVTTAEPARSVESGEPQGAFEVAVIGMAGRYPQSDDLDAFWELLRNGVDAVGEIPAERWDWRTIFDPEPGKSDKSYSRWGAFLKNIDRFDPLFFGISPREAASYDPQARIFFQVAWETLENAGYAARTNSDTGLWVGYSHDHYYEQRIRGRNNGSRGISLETSIANQFSFFMNWRGPSLTVNTLCSSSLVAIHLAINALEKGECSQALVGGVHAALSPEYYITMSNQRALSPTGRCRTFDAKADGYVPGEGVGAVLLKPLKQALADGDRIHGVIKGSAVNHGGRANRLTAPNPEAQSEVVTTAMQRAGIQPADVTFIETHGTGTSLGDPIEVKGLGRVYGKDSQGVLLGSLKSQIGHLESAAGIAGLHKVLLSMKHRTLPAGLHVEELNPALQLDGFEVNRTLRSLPAGKLRAGLSSFGMLGVNAHLIVEEAPRPARVEAAPRPSHVLTLSARDSDTLDTLAARYAERAREVGLADLCYSANTGLRAFDHRLAVVAEDRESLSHALNQTGKKVLRGKAKSARKLKTAMLFTGQGAQYRGMARELYQSDHGFRADIDRCAQILKQRDLDLLDLLFGDAADINQTANAQPALFAVSWSLARLWSHWGVQPKALLGHSVGEYAAACFAGVFDLESGLNLIAERGRLMQSLPTGVGAMLAVAAAESDIAPYLAKEPTLAVAARNAPRATVISGDKEALTRLSEQLSEQGMRITPLRVSHAFHSPLMDPILDAFEQYAAGMTYNAPQIPLIANLTGDFHQGAPTARYWRDHLRGAVCFNDGVQRLAEYDLLLEVGPQPTLARLAKAAGYKGVAVASLQRNSPDWNILNEALAQCFTLGVPIDFHAVEEQRTRVDLPSYPFQQERHWIDSVPDEEPAAPMDAATSTTGRAGTRFVPENPAATAVAVPSAVQPATQPQPDGTSPTPKVSSKNSRLRHPLFDSWD